MLDRKELKQNAKTNIKKHYWIFLLLCLMAAIIGAEFAPSLNVLTLTRSEVKNDSAITAVSDALQLTSTDVGLNVAEQLIQGKLAEGIKTARNVEEQLEKQSQGSVLSRRKGVFADLINKAASGGFYIMIYKMIKTVVASDTVIGIIFSIVFVIFQLFVLFFIKECYRVLMRRLFLEGRTYEHFSMSSIKRHFKGIRWPKMVWTLFVTEIYFALWSLTIVMIPVKICAYAMVPYILAENPQMKANEAITLSRKMMDGHKWEYFKLFLSLLPWYLLDIVTLGLSGIFFTNVYETAIISEYYTKLRESAKEKGIVNADQLNDRYLFEKPDEDLMKTTYADVWELIEQPIPEAEAPKGVRGFFIKWFGIVLYPTSKDREYEEQCALIHNIERWKLIAEGKRYPGRLYPGNDGKEKVNLKAPSYLRNYSLISLILMFFFFAFVGWLWEVSIHLVQDGVFINRGTMYGPWLPIYGAGCVMILVLLKRFRKKPILEFVSAIVLCGIVEYFTHLYLEMTFGIKWWDYTGYFLNLNGRICAEGLLVFGIGGIAVVYALAPQLDNFIRKMNVKAAIAICIILVSFFIADRIYSSQIPNTGKGITDYDDESAQIEYNMGNIGKNSILRKKDLHNRNSRAKIYCVGGSLKNS